ncbi:MAG: hypothetical protein J1E84_02070 [Muribaculaceae bacterium]|nr:hypothetical protein [Muribaculaceae bacterium]
MNLKRYILSAITAGFASILLLTGCVDEPFVDSTSDRDVFEDGPALVFNIELPSYSGNAGSTGGSSFDFDHGEEWENYVDPERMRVLFFDLDGNYLFETDRRHIRVISKDNKWTGTTTTYRVTMPLNDFFKEKDRVEGQLEAIKAAILDDGFKVVTLVNWPYFVEGERVYDMHTDEALQPNDYIRTDLDFVYDPTHEAPNSKISYFTHCIYDNVYGDYRKSYKSPNDYRNEAYQQLVYDPPGGEQAGQMGVYTLWVNYFFKRQSEVRDLIRSGYDASGQVQFHYSYSGTGDNFKCEDYGYTRHIDAYNSFEQRDLWDLWNFSAGKATVTPTCVTGFNPKNSAMVNDYWAARNTNRLIYQLNKKANSQGVVSGGFDIDDLSCNNSNIVYHRYTGTPDGPHEGGYLTVSNNGLMSTEFDTSTKVTNFNNSSNSTLVTNCKNNAIHFEAHGEGGLRVKCANADPDKPAKLLVFINRDTPSTADGIKRTNAIIYEADHDDEYVVEGTPLLMEVKNSIDDVPGSGNMFIIDPGTEPYADVYIVPLDGDVNFYEVGYIRDRITYFSCRSCIMPSSENPIPMYGVQNFDGIREYVELLRRDEIFNVSDINEQNSIPAEKKSQYNYRNVYLLRSVAKVELRIPESLIKDHMPTDVLMCSMNRSARCEPKDVGSPTELLWYGFDKAKEMDPSIAGDYIGAGASAKYPGAKAEFDNIRQYGPFYTPNDKNIGNYRNKISWFYGVWATEYGWNWNNVAGVQLAPAEPAYPRIINSRIDRSAITHMHRVPNKDGYVRYIIYMPEKNIDDCDTKGHLGDSPMLANIQIRFSGMNESLNLEDKNCYYIYFTDYSEINGTFGLNRSDIASTMRGSRELISKLQPVVRNFHYVFTINSINDNKLGVSMSVCGPASRDSNPFEFN